MGGGASSSRKYEKKQDDKSLLAEEAVTSPQREKPPPPPPPPSSELHESKSNSDLSTVTTKESTTDTSLSQSNEQASKVSTPKTLDEPIEDFSDSTRTDQNLEQKLINVDNSSHSYHENESIDHFNQEETSYHKHTIAEEPEEKKKKTTSVDDSRWEVREDANGNLHAINGADFPGEAALPVTETYYATEKSYQVQTPSRRMSQAVHQGPQSLERGNKHREQFDLWADEARRKRQRAVRTVQAAIGFTSEGKKRKGKGNKLGLSVVVEPTFDVIEEEQGEEAEHNEHDGYDNTAVHSEYNELEKQNQVDTIVEVKETTHGNMEDESNFHKIPACEECCQLEGIYGAQWAAYGGHVNCLKHFLGYITEADAIDESGRSALFYAAARGFTDCAEVLVKYRPFLLDLADSKGDTPAHVAACYGHFPILSILLHHGANANARNHKEFTPLHMTTCGDCATLLLDNGNDPRLVDKANRSALFCAAARIRGETVRSICSWVCSRYEVYGYVIDQQDSRGDTAMHAAMCNGKEDNGGMELLQTLIDHGADPNVRNQRGWTPYDLAEKQNKSYFCEVLNGQRKGYSLHEVDQSNTEKAWSKLKNIAGSSGTGVMVSEPQTPKAPQNVGQYVDAVNESNSATALNKLATENERERSVERQRPHTTAGMFATTTTATKEYTSGSQYTNLQDWANGNSNVNVQKSTSTDNEKGLQGQENHLISAQSAHESMGGISVNHHEYHHGHEASATSRPVTAPSGEWSSYAGYEWSENDTSSLTTTEMTASNSATQDEMSDGNWESYDDPETGQKFYVNVDTGELKWSKTPATQDSSFWEEGKNTESSEDQYWEQGQNIAESWIQDQRHIAASTPHRALASGWEECIDETSGFLFYRSTVTGKCQWERPSSQSRTPTKSHQKKEQQLHEFPPEEKADVDYNNEFTSEGRSVESAIGNNGNHPPQTEAKEEEEIEEPEDEVKKLHETFKKEKENLAKSITFERKRQRKKTLEKLKKRKAMFAKKRAKALQAQLAKQGGRRKTPLSVINEHHGMLKSKSTGSTVVITPLRSPKASPKPKLNRDDGIDCIENRLIIRQLLNQIIAKIDHEYQVEKRKAELRASLQREERMKQQQHLEEHQQITKQQAARESKMEVESSMKASIAEMKSAQDVVDVQQLIDVEPIILEQYSSSILERIQSFTKAHKFFRPANISSCIRVFKGEKMGELLWAVFHHLAVLENAKESNYVTRAKIAVLNRESSLNLPTADIDLVFEKHASRRRLNFKEFCDFSHSLALRCFASTADRYTFAEKDDEHKETEEDSNQNILFPSTILVHQHFKQYASKQGELFNELKAIFDREDQYLRGDNEKIKTLINSNKATFQQIVEYYGRSQKRRAKASMGVVMGMKDIFVVLKDLNIAPQVCDLSSEMLYFNFLIFARGDLYHSSAVKSHRYSETHAKAGLVNIDVFVELLCHLSLRYTSKIVRSYFVKVDDMIPHERFIELLKYVDKMGGKEKLSKGSRSSKTLRRFQTVIRLARLRKK
eukprot:g1928.t1